jgi:hypothetical protein
VRSVRCVRYEECACEVCNVFGVCGVTCVRYAQYVGV